MFPLAANILAGFASCNGPLLLFAKIILTLWQFTNPANGGAGHYLVRGGVQLFQVPRTMGSALVYPVSMGKDRTSKRCGTPRMDGKALRMAKLFG